MVRNEFESNKESWVKGQELVSDRVSSPKILVIDDDPIFLAQINRVAQQRNLSVTTCASVRELGAMAVSRLFDVVIVDYFLDDLKTHMKGTEVAAVLEGTPIIFVSASDHAFEDNTPWPASVRKFINKKAGINAILDSAVQLKEGAHA